MHPAEPSQMPRVDIRRYTVLGTSPVSRGIMRESYLRHDEIENNKQQKAVVVHLTDLKPPTEKSSWQNLDSCSNHLVKLPLGTLYESYALLRAGLARQKMQLVSSSE